jgi:DNA-binding PadR family transcriptional regulator
MIKENEFSELLNNLTQELRRGVLVLATLSQLSEPKYGYALIDSLSERGLEIEQGTLYPLLRRLEAQGLLESEWNVEGLLESEWNVEGSRPRRYYVLSTEGARLLKALKAEWGELINVMDALL